MSFKLMAALFVAVAAIGAVYTYRNMATELAAVSAQKAQLEVSMEAVQGEFSDYAKSITSQAASLKRAIAEVTFKYEQSQKKVVTLEKMLNDHDLKKLSLKKPGLIESRINVASNKLLKQLEAATQTFSSETENETVSSETTEADTGNPE